MSQVDERRVEGVAAAAEVSNESVGWVARVRGRMLRLRCSWLLRRDVVVLDVETTDIDGLVCEIAIIDTAGRMLVNTLVRPGVEVAPEARAVHGIDDLELAVAPTWETVWPTVRWALSGCTVVAYNAPFDHAALLRSCTAAGIDPGPVGHPRRWWCLMRARSRIEHRRWTRLGGGRRAHGDAVATLELMHVLADR